ncbi:MAG: hypothetical protein ACD_19C00200G0002 [uncultured bacterium]|nr:MAG: hypothetical protein ACD_19C00200G0002 [uncultured bacterium]
MFLASIFTKAALLGDISTNMGMNIILFISDHLVNKKLNSSASHFHNDTEINKILQLLIVWFFLAYSKSS